jgi:NADPH2:quinone reductase
MNAPTQDAGEMRQIVARAPGGPEQLVIQPMADSPHPGPGEALVHVQAAGVNFLDVMNRRGTLAPPFPFTPGLEGVGQVTQLGEGVSPALAVGLRVDWINVRGSYASELVVPAAQAIVAPDDLAVHHALLFHHGALPRP